MCAWKRKVDNGAPELKLLLRRSLWRRVPPGAAVDFYAGNVLSNQQLKSMPLESLLALVQSQPATKDQAQEIGSRQEVSFTVPFGDLPELTQLSDYSVEILSSQPA